MDCFPPCSWANRRQPRQRDPSKQMVTYWIKAKILTIAISKIFTACALDVHVHTFTYQQYPHDDYIWHNEDKQLPRHCGCAIQKIYFANPPEGEQILSLVASDKQWWDKIQLKIFARCTVLCIRVSRMPARLSVSWEMQLWMQCVQEMSIMRTSPFHCARLD
jgi:hypothetical protein